uniref:Odorant receptor n=1 Tax=Leucinodes orbonalis TaxID=711050 RepID=A0AAU0QMR0_9NEOP|nr:odorant receptor [Leucinodes orbonalis]
MACLVQLLLFYWHSNEVCRESTLVSYGTFCSKWTQAGPLVQREVALLGLTTDKRLVFRAGPFNEMTLTTFIAVSVYFYLMILYTRW